jgi:hypothetical protein
MLPPPQPARKRVAKTKILILFIEILSLYRRWGLANQSLMARENCRDPRNRNVLIAKLENASVIAGPDEGPGKNGKLML